MKFIAFTFLVVGFWTAFGTYEKSIDIEINDPFYRYGFSFAFVLLGFLGYLYHDYKIKKGTLLILGVIQICLGFLTATIVLDALFINGQEGVIGGGVITFLLFVGSGTTTIVCYLKGAK